MINYKLLWLQALQQDILTVEKKVDSLIETCSLITNRAEQSYADVLREKVSGLRKRWDDVTESTEKQKDSLKSACAKLQAIDAGVRDIANMLAGIDVVALKVEFSELDKGMLDEKIKVYKVCTVCTVFPSCFSSSEKFLHIHISTSLELFLRRTNSLVSFKFVMKGRLKTTSIIVMFLLLRAKYWNLGRAKVVGKLQQLF